MSLDFITKATMIKEAVIIDDNSATATIYQDELKRDSLIERATKIGGYGEFIKKKGILFSNLENKIFIIDVRLKNANNRDGVKIIKEIREFERMEGNIAKSLIIAYSGADSGQLECYDAGADKFVKKDMDAIGIKKVIRENYAFLEKAYKKYRLEVHQAQIINVNLVINEITIRFFTITEKNIITHTDRIFEVSDFKSKKRLYNGQKLLIKVLRGGNQIKIIFEYLDYFSSQLEDYLYNDIPSITDISIFIKNEK